MLSNKSFWSLREEGAICADEELGAPAYPDGFTASLCRELSCEIFCCLCSSYERIGILSPFGSALPQAVATACVLWPLLTPADSARLLSNGYEVTSRIPQASPDKNVIFLPAATPFTKIALGDFGFRHVMVTHPTISASDEVCVPWLVHLPPASFRFCLAADTL